MSESKTVTVNENSFEQEVIQSEQPVLVDFWAPWCGPCRMLGPALDELAEDEAGRSKVVKINIDDNPNLAAQFGVQSIPTLIVFHKGEALSTIKGVVPKTVLQERLAAANSATAA